jgi:hypothetical protein
MADGEFDKRNRRKYFMELAWALTLYAAVLIASMALVGRFGPPTWLKAVISLTPLLPISLAILAIWRALKRMDEMQRRETLEVIALAAAGTAFLSLTYGFLEMVGFPRISMFAVWIVMGALWLFIGQARRFGRYL